MVSISNLLFHWRCFPYGGPRSEKRWVTCKAVFFQTPPNWSDVSCLGPVAGRWSWGCGRCDFCSGAPNHFHFHQSSQPLLLSSETRTTLKVFHWELSTTFIGNLDHFPSEFTTTLTFNHIHFLIIIPNHFHSISKFSYFQFKKPRFPDEVEAGLLYAEHMLEVLP